jgi:hypothetical protein
MCVRCGVSGVRLSADFIANYFRVFIPGIATFSVTFFEGAVGNVPQS